MAEVAGLVIGGVGLLALFETCMTTLEYVDAGRQYGKNYQKAALKLECQWIQLSRWRETVDIREDLSGLGDKVQVADPKQVETVRKLLGTIKADLEDAQKTAKRYELEATPGSDDSPEATTVDAVTSRMRELALKRQKDTRFGQRVRWALRDNKKIGRLIDDLKDNVTALVTLFPATVPKQLELAVTDAREVVQPAGIEEPDDEAVKVLGEASTDLDPQLSSAIQALANAKGGYSFNNMSLTDHAKAVYGTYYADGQAVRDHKANSTFNNVNASGYSTALYGDQVGGAHPLGANFHNDIYAQVHGHAGAGSAQRPPGQQMQQGYGYGYGGPGGSRGGRA